MIARSPNALVAETTASEERLAQESNVAAQETLPSAFRGERSSALLKAHGCSMDSAMRELRGTAARDGNAN